MAHFVRAISKNVKMNLGLFIPNCPQSHTITNTNYFYGAYKTQIFACAPRKVHRIRLHSNWYTRLAIKYFVRNNNFCKIKTFTGFFFFSSLNWSVWSRKVWSEKYLKKASMTQSDLSVIKQRLFTSIIRIGFFVWFSEKNSKSQMNCWMGWIVSKWETIINNYCSINVF